jgi:hypothetical protein
MIVFILAAIIIACVVIVDARWTIFMWIKLAMTMSIKVRKSYVMIRISTHHWVWWRKSLVMTFVILHLKIREFTCFVTLSKHSTYIRETFVGHRARRQPVLNDNGYCQTVTTKSQAATNTCRPRRQCSAMQLVVIVLPGVVTILSFKLELSFLSFFCFT